jgi:hypothetical protein
MNRPRLKLSAVVMTFSFFLGLFASAEVFFRTEIIKTGYFGIGKSLDRGETKSFVLEEPVFVEKVIVSARDRRGNSSISVSVNRHNKGVIRTSARSASGFELTIGEVTQSVELTAMSSDELTIEGIVVIISNRGRTPGTPDGWQASPQTSPSNPSAQGSYSSAQNYGPAQPGLSHLLNDAERDLVALTNIITENEALVDVSPALNQVRLMRSDMRTDISNAELQRSISLILCG